MNYAFCDAPKFPELSCSLRRKSGRRALTMNTSLTGSASSGDAMRDKSAYLVVQAFQKVWRAEEAVFCPPLTVFVASDLRRGSSGPCEHATARGAPPPLPEDIFQPGSARAGLRARYPGALEQRKHPPPVGGGPVRQRGRAGRRWKGAQRRLRAGGAMDAALQGEGGAQLHRRQQLGAQGSAAAGAQADHDPAADHLRLPSDPAGALAGAPRLASDGGASLLPAPNPIPVPKSSEALRQPKAILDSRVPLAFLEQVSNHAFPEIETPYGTLCVEVYYKEELHLRREDLEKAPGIGEEGVIIQDYYQKSEPKAKEMSGLGRLLAEAQKEPFVPNLGGYNPPTEWLPREPHLTPPPTARPHVIETDPRHFRRRSTAPIGVPSVGLEPDGSGSQGARQGKAQVRLARPRRHVWTRADVALRTTAGTLAPGDEHGSGENQDTAGAATPATPGAGGDTDQGQSYDVVADGTRAALPVWQLSDDN
eukprot:scaffold1199_cov265-Pinguiococcus_pyrenoidosus.AAC.24